MGHEEDPSKFFTALVHAVRDCDDKVAGEVFRRMHELSDKAVNKNWILKKLVDSFRPEEQYRKSIKEDWEEVKKKYQWWWQS